MPGRRWTGEEKANIVLEMLTTSTSTAEVCRRYNVRPTLVYSWRAGFVQSGTRGLSGTGTSDREKQLEQENKRLKEMVADLALANEVLKKGRARL
ncbi:MAG: transposase [Nitrososphaeraceae archaeon]